MACFMAGNTDGGGGSIAVHIVRQPDHVGLGVVMVRQTAADPLDPDTPDTVGHQHPLGGLSTGEPPLGILPGIAVKGGFDIELLKEVCNAVSVPVIASGGAGSVQDFIDLFKEIPDIDAGLAASVFHFGEIEIADLKKELHKNNITMR